MAKRSRGSSRPGQRLPTQRAAARPAPAGSPTPVRPASSLTADEEARAGELEAQILAEERAAEQAMKRSRDRARAGATAEAPVARGRDLAPLSVRAATEYAYVRRDVWRIARTAGALLATLAILFVLINVAHVIKL